MKECRRRAVAIINKDNEILLIHRINSNRPIGEQEYYVLPGGGIEEGETDLQALKREVVEETSLEVKVKQVLYRLVGFGDNAENAEEIYYLCEYIAGEPRINEGAPEAQKMKEGIQQYTLGWYTRKEIMNMDLKPHEIRNSIVKDMQTCFNQIKEKKISREIS